jgi:glycosyltransferase involved in cell wall biosynthesis
MVSDCESVGGAAVAASRIAAALENLGSQVTRIVSRGAPSERTMVIRAPLRIPMRLTTPRVAAAARDFWIRRAERLLESALDSIDPGVISIHNLHNAVVAGWSPRFVEICAARAPVIWTLHDMWSFTGRCAHSGACEKFIDGCDASCPTAEEYPAFPRARIRDEWDARRRIIAEHPNVVAVAPSRWLANLATRGLWPRDRLFVIPNGVDTSVYRPRERAMGQRIAIAVTQDFRDPQKGGAILATALELLARRGVLCLTVGKNAGAVDWRGANVRHLGWLESEEERAAAYASADFLVHPSLAENLPNVILEAMACGTPSVAYNVGGVAEAVREGETGWLCDAATPVGLARGIARALDDIEHGRDLRESSRAFALQNYDLRIIGSRYEALFTSQKS